MGEPKISVGFRFITGIRRSLFSNVRLVGSWDQDGHPNPSWSEIPMALTRSQDGCPTFAATFNFDPGMIGTRFHWGVKLDGPAGKNIWGIPTEIESSESFERHRTFVLGHPNERSMQLESYSLNPGRNWGAHKVYGAPGVPASAHFRLWAPHAWKVEVVFAQAGLAYVAGDGTGLDRNLGPFELEHNKDDGTWSTPSKGYRDLELFSALEQRAYYYRITLASGKVVYRTDPYSRQQATPSSDAAPAVTPEQCASVIVDLDRVEGYSKGRCSKLYGHFPIQEFWKSELRADRPSPPDLEELSFYQLHLGAALEPPIEESFKRTSEILDHLSQLGIGAIHCIPDFPFESWLKPPEVSGHLLAPAHFPNGRSLLQHFIREAHRRDLLVFLDLNLSELPIESARSLWHSKAVRPDENFYLWSEEGSYLESGGVGLTPDFCQQRVRQLFLASLFERIEDFQVDGLFVQALGSMTQNQRLRDTGRAHPEANLAACRLLRECAHALKLVAPQVFWIAYDETYPASLETSLEQGGLGFSAKVNTSFAHHLNGHRRPGTQFARLTEALNGDTSEETMTQFSKALEKLDSGQLVYHLSREESPHWTGRGPHPPRLAQLAAIVSLVTPGVPLLFMGEEWGTPGSYPSPFETAPTNEPLHRLFQDLFDLRKRSQALRSGALRTLKACTASQMLLFERRFEDEQLLLILNGQSQDFPRGYRFFDLPLADGSFHEIFNPDHFRYGGKGLTNERLEIPIQDGFFEPVLSAQSLTIFRRSLKPNS